MENAVQVYVRSGCNDCSYSVAGSGYLAQATGLCVCLYMYMYVVLFIPVVDGLGIAGKLSEVSGVLRMYDCTILLFHCKHKLELYGVLPRLLTVTGLTN